MRFGKRVILQNHINKYIVKDYPLIKGFEVNDVSFAKNDNLNFHISIICDYEEILNQMNISENLLYLITNPDDDTITKYFLDSPTFNFENTPLPFKKIKKEIKHCIKLIYSKRINEFKYQVKIENFPTKYRQQNL
jgi:hypothetical protein